MAVIIDSIYEDDEDNVFFLKYDVGFEADDYFIGELDNDDFSDIDDDSSCYK